MSTRVHAKFNVSGWEETPFDDGVGLSKLTEALVSKEYSEGIDGTSTTKWLMAYASDETTATFVGIERIQGTVDGLRGSVVLLHEGTFEGGAATATLRVVSGTDQLNNVTGTGTFRADPGGSIELDIETT
ncbi:MAG: hypothetical protein JWR13_5609 [Mycobacterium sp.]|jgi:hypothetical protein|nr:hypothetical protein [Mycobacterium sp.]MDT5313617.1 hypothetical protein [Mycobacterium sp.]